MDFKHLVVLHKQEEEITRTMSEIAHIISDMSNVLNSYDVSIIFAYKSRITEFRRLPPNFTVSLPSFTLQKITKEQFYQQFCSLSELFIETEHDFVLSSSGAESCTVDSQLIEEPHIITDIKTKKGFFYVSYNVACRCFFLTLQKNKVFSINDNLFVAELTWGDVKKKSNITPKHFIFIKCSSLKLLIVTMCIHTIFE